MQQGLSAPALHSVTVVFPPTASAWLSLSAHRPGAAGCRRERQLSREAFTRSAWQLRAAVLTDRHPDVRGRQFARLSIEAGISGYPLPIRRRVKPGYAPCDRKSDSS